MKGRVVAVTAVVALVVGLLGPGAAPAGAIFDVVAGVCVFEHVQVNFSGPSLSLASGTTTVAINGEGAVCATSGGLGIGALRATVSPNLPGGMTCLAGEAHGSGGFDVSPQFGRAFPVNVTVVNTGGVWTVLVVSGLVLLGVGVFVQPAADTLACVAGELRSTTWTGAVAFEDPVLPLP